MAQGPVFLINREISWLSFNERVLQEAEDPSVPLLERLRFLGIYSNNRDEFFRVRVATVRRMIKQGKKVIEAIGENPETLLHKIQEVVMNQQNKFDKTYLRLVKELESKKVFIVNERQLSKEQGDFVKQYFHDHVMPTLFPIMLDQAPEFPYLRDKMIYLIVRLVRQDKEKKIRYSLIEIPTEVLPRFVVLPERNEKKYVMLLEDVIRYCLAEIFLYSELDHIDAYAIKMTRDAELDIDNDISKSVVEKITKSLKKRKRGTPVRLAYDLAMPSDALDYLKKRIKALNDENLIPGGRYHNYKDFINFPSLGLSSLQYEQLHPLEHKDLKGQKSLFRVLRKKDVMLTYPYQSFNHIIDLLREASMDPRVESIQITLYRAARQSNVINALINAVKNGKRVTAVVELQARFDEEANIIWANKLQEEGANVIFGAPSLKVHSKLLLITRREEGKKILYAHIGTGNFNEDTARVYSDFALLTCDKRITSEVEELFRFYSNNLSAGSYKNLLVAPVNMRKRWIKLIHHEIANAKLGKPAWIFIKANNLVDAEMIGRLYEASAAGVKIKLIVRGICSLVTEIAGKSENIEAISIVDKYLEHGRVFIFCNDGDEKYFLSSADWMARNLDYRSEVAVPVYDKSICKEIKKLMDIQWNDNTKARVLNTRQDNRYRQRLRGEVAVRAQIDIYRHFQ